MPKNSLLTTKLKLQTSGKLIVIIAEKNDKSNDTYINLLKSAYSQQMLTIIKDTAFANKHLTMFSNNYYFCDHTNIQ